MFRDICQLRPSRPTTTPSSIAIKSLATPGANFFDHLRHRIGIEGVVDSGQLYELHIGSGRSGERITRVLDWHDIIGIAVE